MRAGGDRCGKHTDMLTSSFITVTLPLGHTHRTLSICLSVSLLVSLLLLLLAVQIITYLLLILSSRHKKKFSQCLHTEFCWLCTPVRFNSIQTTFFIPVGQFSFSLPVVSNKTTINQAFRTAVLYFIHMTSHDIHLQINS